MSSADVRPATPNLPGTWGFEPNVGQASPDVLFLARASRYRLQLYQRGDAEMLLPVRDGVPQQAVRLHFLGTRPGPVERESQLSQVTRYYSGRGKPAMTPSFARIRFSALYPGMDLVWRCKGEDPEFELIAGPGTDTDQVRLRFGTGPMQVDPNGSLVATTSEGPVRLGTPRAWEEHDSERTEVPVRYRITNGTAGFEVERHNRHARLIIDPVLSFSTHMGGSGYDSINGVATDASGNIYVTGETASSTFPGAPQKQRTVRDAFVAKLTPDGSSAVYVTILSGSGGVSGRAITTAPDGTVYVAGVAGGTFPATSNAFQSTSGGGQDVFVAKLSPSGSRVYSTYLGGGGDDTATGIGIDPAGNAYVAGYTTSLQFPTTSGAAQTAYRGGYHDAFVTKLNPSGSGLVYSTLVGGTDNDLVNGIAVTAAGEACVAGSTASTSVAIRNALQSTPGRNGDALIGCLNPAGTQWDYLTYLGGNGLDEALGIALDSSGNAYVTGDTYSSDFPVSLGSKKSGFDAFAVKLLPNGSKLIYSALIGGSDSDAGTSIVVDAQGRATLAGYTSSLDFPVQNAVQSAPSGSFDAFVCRLSTDGTAILTSTYLGGTGDDRALALAVGTTSVLVAGFTGSAGFRVTASALQTGAGGGMDGFVVRIGEPFSLSVTPASGTGASASLMFTVTDSNGLAAGLSHATFLVNTSATNAAACEVDFVAPNQLRILNDAGTSWSATVTIGSSSTLSNSQCSVSASGVGVNSLGDAYTVTVPITFAPGFSGTKNIYGSIQASNGASSTWQTAGTWIIPVVANQAPSADSISPSSGTGMTATLAFTASDPNGYQDINSMQLLINNAFNGVNACYAFYDAGSNVIYLLNDSGSSWLGPSAIGSGGVLKNTYCSLAPASGARTSSGTSAILTIPISFTTAFAGARTIYGVAVDRAGAASSWKTLGSWTVATATNHAPSVASLSPSSGSGISSTFSFTASDADGYGDLSSIQLLVNSSLSTTGACEAKYAPASNSLYLMNDAGTGWVGTSTVGSGAALQNSQCSITPASASKTSNGTTTTLAVPIVFSQTFAGVKTVYGAATDVAGAGSGWLTLGSWTVQVPVNQAPAVVSVTPTSNAGMSGTATFTASDPNGSSDLQAMHLLINNSFNGVQACYVLYDPASNVIYLLNDAGTAWLGPSALGSGAKLTNSACSLSASSGSRTISGTTIALKLPIAFTSTFTGTRAVYALAQDRAGAVSGWTTAATWIVR